MPSSLVFAALVLAWLVVLVPVVARRRQLVPRPAEAHLSARVLPRAAGTPANEELPVTPTSRDRGGSSSSGGGTAVMDRTDREARTAVLDDELDDELDLDAYDGEDDRTPRGAVDELDDLDEADVDDLDDDARDRYDDRYDEGYDGYDVRDDEPAPRGYRPGRGGFDPDAAEVAAQSRYAFRQRVALGLIAVAVLSALAALVVGSSLWWLHLAADVALVGYLFFLRRQTRLEEDLRARRAARMSGERRAIAARAERQAEHEARMAAVRRESQAWRQEDLDARDEDDRFDDDADEYDEYDEYAEYEDDDLDEAPRWIAPRTPAPAVPDGMELVGDSSDDPDHHRLDGRESVPSYRRAAGA